MDRVTARFPGRLGVQQRVLPVYRIPFFDALATACDGGLNLFAGEPSPNEAIATSDQLHFAHFVLAHNLHILSGPLYLCFQRGLVEWLNDWQPDAIIMEANPRYLSTPAALEWARRKEIPVVGWGLGAPLLSGLLAGMRCKERFRFLSRFSALITYSRRGADEYAALGFPAERIFVAPNASTPRPSTPPPQRSLAFDERPTVIFVGRLQVRKRVDNLLRACAALSENLQPRLLIVGEGPDRVNLERLAKMVYPRAEFVGPKFKEELGPFFATADLFVLPGTGGLAVQEAMSYGLPVVMGQGDGTNDDLVRPANGWHIPPEDPGALKDILHTALSDAPGLRAMGAESYRIVVEEINLEKMVEVFMDVLAFCSGAARRA